MPALPEGQSQIIKLPKSNKKHIVIAALLCVFVALGYAYFLFQKSHVILNNAQVSGEIFALSSPYGGSIQNIYVVQGQEVKKGDVLVEFDSSPFRAALVEAQNNLALVQSGQSPNVDFAHAETRQLIGKQSQLAAESRLTEEQAREEYEYRTAEHARFLLELRKNDNSPARIQELSIQEGNARTLKDSAKSRLELASNTRAAHDNSLQRLKDSQRTASGVSMAQVVMWQERVNQAYKALEYTKLLSPEDGTIMLLNAQIGDIKQSAEPFVQLSAKNSKQFFITAFATQSQASRIKQGQRAVLALADKSIDVRVSSVVTMSDGAMITFLPTEKTESIYPSDKGKVTVTVE